MIGAPDWLTARFDGVPEVLAVVLREGLGQERDPWEASEWLLRKAIELQSTRTGAWPLLGADGMITACCDHVVHTDADPTERLARLFSICMDDDST